MSDTKIEWAQKTWNPITGCTPISEGCQSCYAARMAKRLAGRFGYDKDIPFKIVKHDEVFIQPLKWRKPQKVFVCSMGDLFHDDVSDDWILAAFVAMGLTYQHTGKMVEVSHGHHIAVHQSKHTFMLLTKRPQRMKDFICRLYSDEPDKEWEKRVRHYAYVLSGMNGAILPGNAFFTFYAWLNDGMPSLWLGVTAENQSRANERIPILLQTPAAVRFASIEPMLGPVNLRDIPIQNGGALDALKGIDTANEMHYVGKLDQVICGGETGPGARPMHPQWAQSLRDQCQAAEVPFFFKSWGDWQNGSELDTNAKHLIVLRNGETVEPGNEPSITQRDNWQYLRPVMMSRVGKKNAGRLLDGVEWNQYPDDTKNRGSMV